MRCKIPERGSVLFSRSFSSKVLEETRSFGHCPPLERVHCFIFFFRLVYTSPCLMLVINDKSHITINMRMECLADKIENRFELKKKKKKSL